MGSLKKISFVLMSLFLALGLVFSLSVDTFAATKPAKVTISKVAVSKNVATITWKKAKNAKKYEVNVGGKTYTVKTTSYKFTGKSNTSYKVKVRGVNGKTKGAWSAEKSFTTKMSDADTIKALQAENSKLTKENSTLKSENAQLKSDNSDLEKRIADLEAMVDSLKSTVDDLIAQVESLKAQIEDLLTPEESPIVGVWFHDYYKNGHMQNTESYKLNADGTVRDGDGHTGTYTFEGDVLEVVVNGKTLTFDYDAENNVLTRNGLTYEKSLPVPTSLQGEWYLQGEGVWSIMHMNEYGEFYFEYSDVPDSPVYVAHMIDEDTIAILATEYDIEGTILQEVELHHMYYARYTNLYRMWKCQELANPEDDYDGIIWITEDGRDTEWTVENDKYLLINGEKFTINNDDETLSIIRDGHTYIYEIWHDPNVM